MFFKDSQDFLDVPVPQSSYCRSYALELDYFGGKISIKTPSVFKPCVNVFAPL